MAFTKFTRGEEYKVPTPEEQKLLAEQRKLPLSVVDPKQEPNKRQV